jgi:Asp-tRNA(Asn)/Glu-tRNA(Gln) amidotransferase C subunit
MNRSDLSKDDIAALAKAVRLDLPEHRITVLAETMPGIFEMLDVLDDVALGETAPAFAFRAKWDSSQ